MLDREGLFKLRSSVEVITYPDDNLLYRYQHESYNTNDSLFDAER
jgi:hypothetical protein